MKNLKVIKKIWKFLENFNKSFEKFNENLNFSLAIEAYCWLRHGLLPILCKFSGISGGDVPLATPLQVT